ncbi:MAG: protein kinase [Myxococcales bacterium]|nr:protein kinase [Myxococcales bacterium]
MPKSIAPVEVDERIPIRGQHRVSEAEIVQEAIPTPEDLFIDRELGRGGMGRIHVAQDRRLLRNVALKRLDRKLSREPFYRDGFVAEGQMTGQLEHPNIVPVHSLAISPDGVPYFTMKLVDGISFHYWLRDPKHAVGSSVRLEEGLSILVKVCDALAYSHHRGVVHRDIKPDNIMVSTFGQVYLMDFGLARLSKTKPASGNRAQMEAPGAVGTPGYMSPEQARGVPSEMSESTDIFGIGALLYELVSGKLPFGSARDVETLMRTTRQGRVVPIDKATAGVGAPKRLREIIDRATQPKPEDRYPSVVELQRELQAFLRGGLHLPRQLFLPGELIIREGDPGDCAYMIVDGRCRVYRTVDGKQETLMTMEPGEIFGEMALLLGEPRSASVEALDPVALLVLDEKTLEQGIGGDGWASALLHTLAKRFRDLEQMVRRSGVSRHG